MKYEENLYSTLDKIMKQQHYIMTHIINMVQEEIASGKIRKIEETLLEKEFEKLRQYYIELRSQMNNYKIEDYKKRMSYYAESPILTVEEERDVKSDVIQNKIVNDEIKSYITDSYYNMQFISNTEVGIPSIYEGEEYESLRDLEYEAYNTNIDAIENKDDMDSLNMLEIPYKYLAIIIEELAEEEAYKKSYKTLSRMLNNLRTKPDKYTYLKGKDRQRAIKMLSYMKYEEKFKMLNIKYNGALTEEMPISGKLRKLADFKGQAVYLGVSEDDFSKIYESTISDYIFELKEQVKDIFLDEERKSKKNKNRKKGFSKKVKQKILKRLKKDDVER